MATRDRKRLTLAAVFLFVLCAGCSCSPDRRDPKHMILFIVFDPTVSPSDGRDGSEAIVEKLRAFFIALPEDSKVVLRFVQASGAQAESYYEKTFDFDGHYGKEKAHGKELVAEFDDHIAPAISDKWKEMHKSDMVNVPTSCLFTALFAVGRDADQFGCSSEGVDCYLILISDMLEACDDGWGEMPINMENRRSDWETLDTRNLSAIDLRALSSVVFLEVRNPILTSPADVRRLEVFWRSRMSECGVDPKDFRYGTRLPDSLSDLR